MIFVIIAPTSDARRPHIHEIIAPDSEVLVYDDTYGTIADLEHYLYPSLFSMAPPVIHLKYMLATDSALLTPVLIKKMLASPTIFLFEEITVPTATVTLLKKSGAQVHEQKSILSKKREGDIFAVTTALTAPDKKSRWLAYRAALEEHAIEAIIGILYWKIRDLAAKTPSKRSHYNALYLELLRAHARAWETGTPLELMVEKILLTQ